MIVIQSFSYNWAFGLFPIFLFQIILYEKPFLYIFSPHFWSYNLQGKCIKVRLLIWKVNVCIMLLDTAKFLFIVIVSFCTLRNSIKRIYFPRVCGNSVFSSFWIFVFNSTDEKLYLYSLVLIWISFIMLEYILYM